MINDLTEDAINLVFSTHCVGHLGCVADGEPYVVPVTYIYDDGYVYGHTNRGRKMDSVRSHPNVCFQVDDIQDMKHWRSVIGWGRFEELEGEAAAKALDLLFTRLPKTRSESSVPAEAASDDIAQQIKLRPTKGVVYRVHLDRKSGRFERP